MGAILLPFTMRTKCIAQTVRVIGGFESFAGPMDVISLAETVERRVGKPQREYNAVVIHRETKAFVAALQGIWSAADAKAAGLNVLSDDLAQRRIVSQSRWLERQKAGVA